MLFDFFLFHHVQFVLVGVDEFILQEAQTLIRDHFNTHRVFQFPFPTERESSALDKCCNIRMYVQGEFLHVVFVDQAVDLSFQAVDVYKRQSLLRSLRSLSRLKLASLRQQTLRTLTAVSALDAHQLRPEVEPDGSLGMADAACFSRRQKREPE